MSTTDAIRADLQAARAAGLRKRKQKREARSPWGSEDARLRGLLALLEPWSCCGSPSLCGARCLDDPLSEALAKAHAAVRLALEAR